jgi:predicted transcriptional regulator
MKVEEIMKKKVEFIEGNSPAFSAIEIMVDKGIRSLLVKPSTEKDDYGFISVKDIIFKVLGLDHDPIKVKCKEIMRPIVSIEKGKELIEAARLMRKFGVGRVFVKEGGKVIGIIAMLDVISYYLGQQIKKENRYLA